MRAVPGQNNNFGRTKGQTVEGTRALEAIAKEALSAAVTEEDKASANQLVHDATDRRKLTETARADQGRGGERETSVVNIVVAVVC